MPGALVGARSCGRCAATFSDRSRYCSRCGVLRVAPASGSALGTYPGLLAGVQSAAPSRRRLSQAIDFAPIVAGVAVTIVVASGAVALLGAAWLGSVVAIAALVLLYCAFTLVILARRGRSLGRWMLALRTVDDLTGRPSVSIRAAIGSRSHTVTADLRRGRDPVKPGWTSIRSLSPVGAGAPSIGTAERSLAAPYRPLDSSPSVMLVLDTGERLLLESSLLIGRLPVAMAADDQPIFSWPDLSRSLSKTHARLEWTGTVLWVTDLQSTNGSALVSPEGARQPLVPGIRGPAAPGWMIELGERRLAVHPSGHVDEPAASPQLEDESDGR